MSRAINEARAKLALINKPEQLNAQNTISQLTHKSTIDLLRADGDYMICYCHLYPLKVKQSNSNVYILGDRNKVLIALQNHSKEGFFVPMYTSFHVEMISKHFKALRNESISSSYFDYLCSWTMHTNTILIWFMRPTYGDILKNSLKLFQVQSQQHIKLFIYII